MEPVNVGVLDVEFYFPKYYVSQKKLELCDNGVEGKYTIGFGQENLSFCSAREDAISMALTVVKKLMEKTELKYDMIGRIDVGTESNVDKSKSIKSHIMSLFEEHAAFNIEGADNVNACYGGTAALFNVLDWIDSRYWDGRYGMVVATDIASYERSDSAHATGGVGAVAMLVGPGAPIVFDPGMRVSYMRHVYDFYKPVDSAEYPYFDGRLSLISYYTAVLNCWNQYRWRLTLKDPSVTGKKFTELIDYVAFHSPFSRIITKAISYLIDLDNNIINDGVCINGLFQSKVIKKYEEIWKYTKTTKDFETRITDNIMNDSFHERVDKSLYFAKNIGNMYTSSVFSCLLSTILKNKIEDLYDKNLLVFSYGSGFTSSMYSLKFRRVENKFSLKKMKSYLACVNSHLVNGRIECSPEEYNEIVSLRENVNKNYSMLTDVSIESINKGVYYLNFVDDRYRRFYARKLV